MRHIPRRKRKSCRGGGYTKKYTAKIFMPHLPDVDPFLQFNSKLVNDNGSDITDYYDHLFDIFKYNAKYGMNIVERDLNIVGKNPWFKRNIDAIKAYYLKNKDVLPTEAELTKHYKETFGTEVGEIINRTVDTDNCKGRRIANLKDVDWFKTYYGINETQITNPKIELTIYSQSGNHFDYSHIKFTIDGCKHDAGRFVSHSYNMICQLFSIPHSGALQFTIIKSNYMFEYIINVHTKDAVPIVILDPMGNMDYTNDNNMTSYVYPNFALSPNALFVRHYLSSSKYNTHARINQFANIDNNDFANTDPTTITDTHMTVGVNHNVPLISNPDRKITIVSSKHVDPTIINIYGVDICIAICTSVYKSILQVAASMSKDKPVIVYLTSMGKSIISKPAMIAAMNEYKNYNLRVILFNLNDHYDDINV